MLFYYCHAGTIMLTIMIEAATLIKMTPPGDKTMEEGVEGMKLLL